MYLYTHVAWRTRLICTVTVSITVKEELAGPQDERDSHGRHLLSLWALL